MKRMFDKEEIVEIAKEEGGSVTVDSELSPTSENPVQNKVIYEALENVGGKVYAHYITLKSYLGSAVYGSIVIISNSSTITKDDVAKLLYSKGYTSKNRGFKLYSGYNEIKITGNSSGLENYFIGRIWAPDETTLNCEVKYPVYAFSIVDNAITITYTDQSLESYVRSDDIYVLTSEVEI